MQTHTYDRLVETIAWLRWLELNETYDAYSSDYAWWVDRWLTHGPDFD
jgi:hypothetical protein